MTKKIWYATSTRPYAEDEPWVYDAKNYPALLEMETHWPELKEEIKEFIKEKDNKFVSVQRFYEKIDKDNGWSSLIFLFWGLNISREFKKKCPKTMRYLKKIPGVTSISFSRLAPKCALAEHTGDTNAILRCHFGVEIPAVLPNCGLRVNGEAKAWQEGKWNIFNDAYRHEAWNNTDKRRIVLIVDMMRPEFLRQKNMACAFIITRHISYIYHKVNLIARGPVFLKTILFTFFLGIVYVLRPVYNLFK